MIERRAHGSTTKQCARFGCSAIGVATFTFDSATRTVWLDTPQEGNARAGELCARHARLLTPPRGWTLEDRRGRESASPALPAEEPQPLPEEPRQPAEAGARQLAAGPADIELEDELRGLLDAQSPLLARAFRSSGTV